MTVSLGATITEDLGIDVLSLLVFARVVDCGGVSQAAAELQLSRSAVSRRLTDLEARVGVRLLARSTRRLTPTEAGDALLQHCRRIADEARAAADAVGVLAAGGAKGLLRVSLPPTLAKRCILPKLGGFLTQHPDVSLDLLLTDVPFAELSWKVDVAVRIIQGVPEGFIERPLCNVEWLVVAAPSYFVSHAPPTSPDEVAAHLCLLFTPLTPLTRPASWSFTIGSKRREVRLKARVRANSLEALATLAEQGVGLALLPLYAVADALRDGRMTTVLPNAVACPTGGECIYAVYAPPTATAPRLRAFLAFLEECLAPYDVRSE